MADLNNLQAAETTKIVGSDLSGVETTPLAVDSSQQALVTDAATHSGLSAIELNQTDGTQKTQIVDAANQVITSSDVGARQAIDVSVVQTDSQDALGVDVTGVRNNQIEINFQTVPGATFITNTTSGGATISATNGHTLYSTGTATSANAKGVSVRTVVYRPAHEIYSFFTAAFTTPTNANSWQRIGIYDSNNGFFIGYEGTTFGLTKRTSGVDTRIARGSFNEDLLDGSAGSKFTRNGVPEAINLTFSNLFRIRFAWLGSANITFEVYSPDGIWVKFHTIRQANSSFNPSVATPNLPMTIDVYKATSDATNLIMATACWGAGTTSGLTPIVETITDTTLAALNRSVITGATTAGGGGYVNVKVSPSGAVQVGGTLDAVTAITNPLPTGTNTIGAMQIEGSSDSTRIGNVGDALKVSIASEFITASVATYTASFFDLNIDATNCTDFFVLRGSATKKVKIVDIQFSALKQNTSYLTVLGYKRVTDNTGGTFTTAAVTKHETTDPASGAQVRGYTDSPTALGTAAGSPVMAFYAFIPSATAAGGAVLAGVDVLHGVGKPIVLTGTNEIFALNLNNTNNAGMTANITVTWIEDNT